MKDQDPQPFLRDRLVFVGPFNYVELLWPIATNCGCSCAFRTWTIKGSGPEMDSDTVSQTTAVNAFLSFFSFQSFKGACLMRLPSQRPLSQIACFEAR